MEARKDEKKLQGAGIKKKRLLSWLLAMDRVLNREAGKEEVIISGKGLCR